MPTVGKLTIDLEAGTYQYTSTLDKAGVDAEKAAGRIKGAFDKVDFAEARGGMMLFDDLIGVKLPRHVTSFISSLGPIGAAMEAAFPFLAIAVGAVVLIEHLTKLKETAEKLDNDTAKFETTVNNTFSTLDDKLLQAQKKADELNGNHLGALAKELKLIDHASMKELMQTFDQLAKAVDAVFADMKSHWYNVSLGSEGAQHALTEFQKQYDLLLSKGKDKDAGDLLAGTRKSAQDAMNDLQFLKTYMEGGSRNKSSTESYKDFERFQELQNKYRINTEAGLKTQMDAQQELLGVLDAQIVAQQKIAAIKNQETDNAKHETGNRLGDEAFRRMKEEERQQHEEDRQREEAYRQAVEHIQEGEKEKVAATKQGTAERLAAIDAAIKEENNKGLQETGYYKELVQMRNETIGQMAEEGARVRAEAGKIAAEHDMKMADLSAAADLEQIRHRQAMRKKSDQDDIDAEIEVENKKYEIKQRAYEKEIAALGKNDKDYQNKLKALQNKEEELTKQHEDKITEIKDKAEERRNDRILAAERQLENSIAQGLTSVLMRQESFGKMMLNLGDQLAAGMLKNALMSMMTMDMTREKDAAHAARKAFNAGMDFPFPINIAMAPVLAAGAFAAVMAFNRGGLVPGSGNGDIIPALLTPGERILTVDENRIFSKSGLMGGKGGDNTHVHLNPVFHNKYSEEEMMRVMDRWAKKNARRNGQRWTN